MEGRCGFGQASQSVSKGWIACVEYSVDGMLNEATVEEASSSRFRYNCIEENRDPRAREAEMEEKVWSSTTWKGWSQESLRRTTEGLDRGVCAWCKMERGRGKLNPEHGVGIQYEVSSTSPALGVPAHTSRTGLLKICFVGFLPLIRCLIYSAQ